MATVAKSSPKTAVAYSHQPPRHALVRDHVLNPITALAFYRTPDDRVLVLVGEDVWLKVYDALTSELLGQLQIFDGQPIHGLHVSSVDNGSGEQQPVVLVWGAQLVATLPRGSLALAIQGGTCLRPRVSRSPDWIYDGLLSPYSATSGVLVTAHNEIIPISINPDDLSICLGDLASPSRPILYSAALTWLSDGCVLVAAGTVFGEIVVWKYHADSEREASCDLLFVLTGHDGSIFGVSISPELEIAPAVKVRLLASCSDDRTIRVWDITERAEGVSRYMETLREARETGFGPNSLASLPAQDGASRCIALAMAHISRIWHVKFSGRRNHCVPHKVPVELFSFGEDATRISWKLDIDDGRWGASPDPASASRSPQVGTLREVDKVTCHMGKNIWSVAVLETQGEDPLTVTGGADSKIALLGGLKTTGSAKETPNTCSALETPNQRLALSFNDILDSVQTSAGAERSGTGQGVSAEKDSFKNYAFLSDECILLTATSGRLFIGSLTSRLTWTEIKISAEFQNDLKGYNVVRSPCQGVVFLGTGSGQLYLYSDTEGLQKVAKVAGKIAEIITLPSSGLRRGGKTSLTLVTVLITIVGRSDASIATIDVSSSGPATHIAVFDREQPFSITAADEFGDTLVAGSRSGAIAIYRKTPSGFVEDDLRRDSASKDSITSITPLPGSSVSFLATCRDSKYRIYTIRDAPSGRTTLELRHETSPPLNSIEGALFAANVDGKIHLILHGFRKNLFVVWNETTQQEIACVDCSGGRRSWAYASVPSSPEQFLFLYTRIGQMHLYRQSRASTRVLKAGGHGREIKAVAYCDSYVATGAEDTTIRIWRYHDSQDPLVRNLQCVAVLEKHTAGIQCLKWFKLGTTLWLFSSAGNEEFFIWRIATFDSHYSSVSITCEAKYTDRTPDGDLRVLDFDVQSVPQDSMSDTAAESSLLISLLLSNSTLRTYLYGCGAGGQGKLVLLAEGQYTGAAMTQIRGLPCRGQPSKIQCLTAATDGHLAIWCAELGSSEDTSNEKRKAEFSLVKATKLHQSTIKSLDLKDEGDRLFVVTGGDDNALGLLELMKPSASEPDYQIVRRSRVKDAHAAAVIGVCIVGSSVGPTVEVASVSNDQRVKLWRAETQNDRSVSVSLLENKYSSIADPGDMTAISFNQASRTGLGLMVVGVGMEIWCVRRDNGRL